jgi:hypothetical protein
MIFSRTLIVAASMVGLVSSQTWTAVNISAIDPATRSKWCLDQTSSCPLLCLQINATSDPRQNECDSDSLSYQCVCSNGISPNTSEYSQTIPFYLCMEANNECVDRCSSADSACQLLVALITLVELKIPRATMSLRPVPHRTLPAILLRPRLWPHSQEKPQTRTPQSGSRPLTSAMCMVCVLWWVASLLDSQCCCKLLA